MMTFARSSVINRPDHLVRQDGVDALGGLDRTRR